MCSVAVRVIGKSAAMSLNFRFRTARAAAELRRVISIMRSSERSSHLRYHSQEPNGAEGFEGFIFSGVI
jgi:hypothetical protein